MKILLHSNYRPSNTGGIEKVVLDLIQVLSSAGYNLQCFYGSTKNESFVIDGVHFFGVRILFKLKGACFLFLGNWKFFFKGLAADLVIYQEPYPSMWPACFFLRLFRKKIIVLVHADPIASPKVHAVYSFLREVSFKDCHFVFTSPYVQSSVNSKATLSSSVIPLCIGGSEIIDISSVNIPVPQEFVLFFGRLVEYKGVDYLLKAALRSQNINLVIAGTGPLRDSVHEFITRNKLNNITFIDRYISEEEKLFLIRHCRFFVFPSVTRNEAFGLVQLEVMRESKAIVNTCLDSGVNFVAPHGVCALTVSPANVDELAKAMCILWEDSEMRFSFGKNSILRYQALFSFAKFSESWLLLVRKFRKM